MNKITKEEFTVKVRQVENLHRMLTSSIEIEEYFRDQVEECTSCGKTLDSFIYSKGIEELHRVQEKLQKDEDAVAEELFAMCV